LKGKAELGGAANTKFFPLWTTFFSNIAALFFGENKHSNSALGVVNQ